MSGEFTNLVIVGGGTAGWLSACLLAARRPELAITLIEAPDIPTVGVGEGSWPTLRETLAVIGIDETEFLTECDASFKQGSRFDGWVDGSERDCYYHPFSAPLSGSMPDILTAWKMQNDGQPYAEAVSPQAAICNRDLAPRQRTMPPFAGALNYGYHLDAGKFGALLASHGIKKLGVRHVHGKVTRTERGVDGLFTRLLLDNGSAIEGDFFIDCTGMASKLMGEELGIGWVDRSNVSFNDRALAVQVPVVPDSAIASQTIGTAHRAGWLWDIGLPTRRGVGCVYSSGFLSDDEAQAILMNYIGARIAGAEQTALTPRLLKFSTGYRDKFWAGNCLAIGLSAGFIEPLEASAIVLIELSLKALADGYPQSRTALPRLADRFNSLFRYRWERIVDFLKLHYVLSTRTEPYWQAHRDPATIPSSLAAHLDLWRDHAPSSGDFPQIDEIFSAASHQYVLYGMRFPQPADISSAPSSEVQRQFAKVAERSRALSAALPSNRAYFDALCSSMDKNSARGVPTRQ